MKLSRPVNLDDDDGFDFDKYLDENPEALERFEQYLESLRCCSIREIAKRTGKDLFADEQADEIVILGKSRK